MIISRCFLRIAWFSAVLFVTLGRPISAASADRWPAAKAEAWLASRPFLAGGNYLPSTAINQLEMWQADTFDPAAIDRELGWAHGIGFNTMRVFLHNLPWRDDREGFFQRIDTFLSLAEKHQISVLFVLFDSCWDPYPRGGPQRAPRPHVHNSGWVQSPGQELLMNGRMHGELKAYVKDVLRRFANDRRILGWDVFNEPNNPNSRSYGILETPYKAEYALILLKETFQWAREVNPSQPLTAGVWEGNWAPDKPISEINRFMLENSDVISFHCYEPVAKTRERIEALARFGRPILCTEFMARPRGSRFETHLPLFKEKHVAAIAWGFVAGKSQTNYPWDSWDKTYKDEPSEWFHDVLRADGTPYREKEVQYLRETLRSGIHFGTLSNGTPIERYTLTNPHGLVCRVITYGGIITELQVPDRAGKLGDVVLGCDDLVGYLRPAPYFGAIVGRVANRIAHGQFVLDGVAHTLAKNDGPNHLHGGLRGFDKVVWRAQPITTSSGEALELRYRSPAGEEGYPGNVDIKVVYTLTTADELRIDYEATTDRATPINLSNHTYWNLAGQGSILDHRLTLKASHYTPVDETLIPTGNLATVAGGPMDFTVAKPIGRDLPALTNTPRGYDHNFCLDASASTLAPAARLEEPISGRVMEVQTDQPGLQFYSGNFLDGTLVGKRGIAYRQYDGLCLETQHYPDSVHRPEFPSTILRPGQVFRSTTVYRFSVQR